MFKKIFLSLIFSISMIGFEALACSGVYYGCSAAERAQIKANADLNCCQGDTIWIDNCDPDTIPEPYEVALNGSNAECPSIGD
jgi:hypothetical protein